MVTGCSLMHSFHPGPWKIDQQRGVSGDKVYKAQNSQISIFAVSLQFSRRVQHPPVFEEFFSFSVLFLLFYSIARKFIQSKMVLDAIVVAQIVALVENGRSKCYAAWTLGVPEKEFRRAIQSQREIRTAEGTNQADDRSVTMETRRNRYQSSSCRWRCAFQFAYCT